MNVHFEMKLRDIVNKIISFINNFDFKKAIELLKSQKDVLGLSFILLSLFITNRILSIKRKYDKVREIIPGKIHILEGKVF